MKCLLLRFEDNIALMLFFVALSIFFSWMAWFAFSEGEIAMGVLASFLDIVMIIFLLYFIFYAEVIIDFKHNRLKMRFENEKSACDLDKVKKLEIVFQWVENMGCYSATINAILRSGRVLAINIIPKPGFVSFRSVSRGKISKRSKKKIESKVREYDFIVCRTEEKKS